MLSSAELRNRKKGGGSDTAATTTAATTSSATTTTTTTTSTPFFPMKEETAAENQDDDDDDDDHKENTTTTTSSSNKNNHHVQENNNTGSSSSIRYCEEEDENEHGGLYRLTPLIQYGPWRRLDVGPFAILYLVLMAADHYYYSTRTTTITVLFGMTLVCHASLVICTQWSVAWRVFVGYQKQQKQQRKHVQNNKNDGSSLVADNNDEEEEREMLRWTHCFVQPLHSTFSTNTSSGSDIAPVTFSRGDNIIIHKINSIKQKPIQGCCVAIVNFQNHIFRYCPRAYWPDGDVSLWQQQQLHQQHQKQQNKPPAGAGHVSSSAAEAIAVAPTTGSAKFRPLQYPVHLPLSFYATWQGHSSLSQMTAASKLYGPNQTVIQLPSFWELLGEQLVAPFFLFQVFCVALWSLDEYWYYAIFTLFALIMFESTMAFNRHQSLERLHHSANTHANQRLWVRRQILTSLRNNNNSVVVQRQASSGSSSSSTASYCTPSPWMLLPKSELVPGDYVSLSASNNLSSAEGIPIPADILLIQGTAVCDEALLTGESVPQLKQALDTSCCSTNSVDTNAETRRLDLQDNEHKESILFGGTFLLVANPPDATSTTAAERNNNNNNTTMDIPPPDDGVRGIVLRTGFETTQGNLLRSMAHSARTADGGVHTLDTLVFILLLIACAVGAAAYVLQHGWNDERRNRFRLVLHVIIIVTSVVPPELPMELSLAITNSVAALVQRSKVYCSELFRIPWAGEVNVCCFDKTGTLTSDEMRLRGVRLPDSSTRKDHAVVLVHEEEETALKLPDEDIEDIPRDTIRVMVACHSLTPGRCGSGGRGGSRFLEPIMVGDPLEQAVLKRTGYRMLGGQVVAPYPPSSQQTGEEEEAATAARVGGKALTILHRFAFSSKLKRMTVLVIEEGDKQRKIWVLSKGAPETMKELLTPKSIPHNYDEMAFHHMSLGRRVLAMACRSNVGTLANLQQLKDGGRGLVETQLVFCGFLVLDCPLKPDSKAIITELSKTNHIANVMITGDAILTAVEVARQVGIIRVPPKSSSSSGFVVYHIQPKAVDGCGDSSGDGASTDENGKAQQLFECVDIAQKSQERLPFSQSEIPQLRKLQQEGRAAFSIAGDVLLRMAQTIMAQSSSSGTAGKYRSLSLSTTNDEKVLLLHPTTQEFLSELVPLVSVFARHAPHQKEAVVAAFNHGGFRTLMVGDGTNDVGALKRAHVGISIISAPEVEAKQRKATDALSQSMKLEKKKDKKKKKERHQLGKKEKSQLERSLEQLREAQEQLDCVELGDASVAAPFTSRAVSIKCVKDVIQQGRCTLVTMLQIYKILGINCLVNAMVLSNLYLHGVKQGDRQLTILGIAVATLFFFVTRAEPLSTLSPTKPPSSVLCLQAMMSIVLQFCVHLMAIVLATQAALVFVDPYDPSLVPDGPFNPNVLNSCTFMLTCVATVNTFAVNYWGRPFMKDLHENKLMYRSLQVCYSVFGVCALEIFLPLNDLMQLTALPDVRDRIHYFDSSNNNDQSSATPDWWFWLIHIVETTGFPLFIFGLMVLDTALAFAAERFARRYF